MAQLAPILMAAGIATTVIGQVQSGRAAKDAADLQAQMAETQGNEVNAAKQRQALEAKRQGRLATSRARALAANSGAGADDPTVMNIMGDLETQSEYNAMSRLYEGQAAQNNLQLQARASRAMGKQARNQAILQATGTLLDGGSSLYERFGQPDAALQKPGQRSPAPSIAPQIAVKPAVVN